MDVRFAPLDHSVIRCTRANSSADPVDAVFMMNPNNPHNANHLNNPPDRDCFPCSDPLRQSNKSILKFPTEAATRLSEQRKDRYDDFAESIEEVELRLRVLASIMGLYPTNDGHPSAA